jgi:hypothetical protein
MLGWLLLVEVVLVLTLVRLAIAVLYFIDALDAAGWNAAAVHDGLDAGTYFTVSLLTTTALFGWWLAVTVMFFRRSRRFPSTATTLLLSWLMLTLGQVMIFRGMTTPAATVQVVAIVSLFLYLRRSKRVKATFVR